MGPGYGYDPNPDYELSDEAEFFFKYLTWGLRGVESGGGYPRRTTRRSKRRHRTVLTAPDPPGSGAVCRLVGQATSMVSYRGRVTSQPNLPGAWNFRDVSETTGALRPGRLFRSSELSRLEDRGREELLRLGVSDVADLRSPREVTRRGPGLVPAGVGIHLLPFPDLAGDQSPDSSAPHEDAFRNMMAEKPDADSAADVAARYMLEEYERFPTLAGSRRAVQRVVSLLAEGRPVLAHCFAGKDRTGFVVAVVLRAAGVDRDAVIEDYLRSNTAVSVLRDRIMEMIRSRPEAEITPRS